MIHVKELLALPSLMEQAENVCIARHVSFEDYLRLFDEEVHGKIRGSALAEGVTHVVCFEVLDMWSSRAGQRQSLIVGSAQTFSLEKVLRTPYFRLGDVPSRFAYPVAYASVAELKQDLPAQGVVDKAAPGA